MKKQLCCEMGITTSTINTAVAYVTSLPQQQAGSNACGLHVILNMRAVLSVYESISSTSTTSFTPSLQNFAAYPSSADVETLRRNLVSLYSQQTEDAVLEVADDEPDLLGSPVLSLPSSFSQIPTSVTTSIGDLTPERKKQGTQKKAASDTNCNVEQDLSSADAYRKNGTELILSHGFAIKAAVTRHVESKIASYVLSRPYMSRRRRQRHFEEMCSPKLLKLMSADHIERTLHRTECGCQKSCFSKFSLDDVATLRR